MDIAAEAFYYRCLGSDDYRYPDGRRCTNRPVRQDALDALVCDEVIRLLENPSLVRQEIDRRLAALRTEHPITMKRESLVKTLDRIRGAIGRLIEAYQEELLSLEELRKRMPSLRQRETTAAAQLVAFDAELTDAETYVTLAQSLEGFLAKLQEAAHTLARADPPAGRPTPPEGSTGRSRHPRAQAFDPCSWEPS